MRIPKTVLTEPSWRTAVIVLLMISLLVPVVVGTTFFFPYVVPRNLFFRAFVEVGVAALVLALCFGRRTLDLHDEPILWSLVLFLAAATLSAIFSPATTHSLFGDFERMGGVWAWLHLGLFFLLLRTLRDEDWGWVLNAALFVGLFVSISTIVEHAQFAAAAHASDTIVAASPSTIGNSGLLAAYLLMNVALAGYLAATSVRFRLLYVAAGGVVLLALIYAENRSSILGLALGSIVGGVIFAALGSKAYRRWMAPVVAVLLAAALAGISAGIRAYPNSSIVRHVPSVLKRFALTNPEGSDESRAMQWRAALEGFRDRPVLGYGPENHNLVWSAHFNPGIYRIDTDIYDRTHNQFLEILATTGLVGTIAFLGIWIAIGVTLVRAYRAGRLTTPALAVLAGLQIAYATYLFFWFVDVNSTMLWILIAALIASRGTVGSVVLEKSGDAGEPVSHRWVAVASLLVLAATLYGEGYTPMRANRALARIDSHEESLGQILPQFKVLAESRARQTSHAPMIMSQYLGSLRQRLKEMQSDSIERRMVDSAFTESFEVFSREISRDPLNDRLYTHEAGLFSEAARLYGTESYQRQAIDALHRAIDLSPHRIEQRLALAGLYSRQRDYERAIVVLNDAVKADPQLGAPRYSLAEAYIGAGQSDSALAMLESALARGFVGEPETYLAMGKRLEFSGRNGAAARLYSAYLEAKYTEAVWDKSETIDKPVPTTDIAVAAHLPLLYMHASESELAIKTAAALSAFDPTRATIVDRFVSDVGSRRRGNWGTRVSLLPCTTTRAARSKDPIALGACGVFRRRL